MKKFLKLSVLSVLLLGFTQVINAQEVSYNKGDLDLNLGVGLTTGLGFTPVYFGANYMIMDFLSVGAEVGYRYDRQKFYTYYSGWGDYSYTRSGFVFLTRGDYHFNELINAPTKFDVYAGIDLGMGFFGDYKYEDVSYSSSNFYFLGGPHVGGRWLFKESFGLNFQTGFRTNDGYNLQFGLTFKL
ncbi:MAG: hypothetical protein B6D61_04030 [Bacteroidetes bacterium 4484_249]|nr:MAG: hypothetical protein B6D61_04030 [Bacteroidetes bacterium 4484_249]